MHQQYPPLLFWAGLLLKFLSRVYLFLPGTLLLFLGIWSKTALVLGLILLAVDFGLALFAQIRIKRSFARGESAPFLSGQTTFSGKKGSVIDTVATERDLTPDQDLLNG